MGDSQSVGEQETVLSSKISSGGIFFYSENR